MVEVVPMSIVQYSTKLASDQVEALRRISEKTHIPQAVLVRQAIEILIKTLGEKSVSLDFLSLVKKRVKEDAGLFKRLSSSSKASKPHTRYLKHKPVNSLDKK